MNIKEFLVKKAVKVAEENITKLVDSRTAVRKPQGEAKEERKRGKSAPGSKRPWLVLRSATRTTATVLVGIVGFFFADKLPVLGDPQLQGLIVDGITSLAVIRFSYGAANDWLRLSPARGV